MSADKPPETWREGLSEVLADELPPPDESITEPSVQPSVPVRMSALGGYSLMFALVTMLSNAVSFLMLPIYTRLLTPAMYGAIELVELTFDVLTMVAGARLIGGVFRYYFKAESVADKKAVLTTGTLLISCGYVVVGIAAYLGAEPIARLCLRNVSYVGLVQVGSLTLGTQGLGALPPALLRLQGRFRYAIMFLLARLVVQVALNVVLLVHYRLGPNAIFLSTFLANLVVGGGVLVYLVLPMGLRFSRPVAAALYRYGLPLIAVQGATFILTFGDRYFLNTARDLTTVGVYALAYKFAFSLNNLTQTPFSMVWEPVRFEVATHADHDTTYARVFVYFSIALLAGALGIAMFVSDVLHVIATAPFYGAAYVVPILLISIVFQAWTAQHETGILVSERTGYLTIANWLAAGVTLLAYWILIPRWGGWGAAWATVIGYGVRYGLTYSFSQHVWPIRYHWRPVLELAAMTGGTYALSRLIPQGPLVYALPGRIALYVAYLVAVWYSNVLSHKDRSAAVRLVAQTLAEPVARVLRRGEAPLTTGPD